MDEPSRCEEVESDEGYTIGPVGANRKLEPAEVSFVKFSIWDPEKGGTEVLG